MADPRPVFRGCESLVDQCEIAERSWEHRLWVSFGIGGDARMGTGGGVLRGARPVRN